MDKINDHIYYNSLHDSRTLNGLNCADVTKFDAVNTSVNISLIWADVIRVVIRKLPAL